MLTVRPDAAVRRTHPLSKAQWGWWLAQQLHPAVPMTVAMYLDLAGPLDIDLLARSARQAARELESPHLRVCVVDGTPCQYVDLEAPLPFDTVDTTSEADPVAAALDRMERDYSAPLDPRADRPTVAVLFTVGPDRHLMYLRSHHIFLDGVGAAAVVRRTAELYRAALSTERPSPAKPLASEALPVARLLEDERAYQDSSRADADRAYWHDRLAGVDEPVSLTVENAPPQARPHHSTATLDPATARLLALAKAAHGATFPELTIAAFACYLARMTGSAEVVLTLPVTARPTAALRRSAGSLSNVVPLRLRDLDVATVGEIIAQVRSAVIGALRHQRHRHEDIRRENPSLRAGFGPVVNVLGFIAPLRFGPLVGHGRVLALGPVADLQVNGYQVGPDERSVCVDFQANPARYRHETMIRHQHAFLNYFAHFLAAEKDCVAADLDPAPKPVPPPSPPGSVRTLPELLRAAMTPDAVAVSDRDRTLTYRELDEASSRWSRALLARGAGPGDLVVVAVPRSAESVLALWAVAKSGACFVPIDPDDPPLRVATVISNCAARWGITVGSVRDRLPNGDSGGRANGSGGVDWLVLDDPGDAARAARLAATPITDADRPRPLRPAHPAYLIHTSGTTGTPKGVVVGHHGLGALTDYLVEHYGLNRDSVLLHSHTATFDAHLLELLGAFAAGGRLVVAPPTVIAGAELARLIRTGGCTVFQTAPAVLATLAPDRVPGLEVVAVGGAPCPATLVREWAPHVRLFNGYGPTEATVMATETGALTAHEPVTIGRALPGMLAAVLDSRLRCAPAGARGELYLGGPALAHGYLHDPAGTAARFIANPFGGGDRLYRTGDLVGSRPDGAFEYLRRLDGQLELHGRRIEPTEIEAALLAVPGITAAAVTVADARRPGARLVGYVVAAEGIGFDAPAALRRLRDTLPAAMVPAMLIELDRMPLSGNGKIDRSALPPPARGTRPTREPQTELERLVATRYGAALGADNVGRDDDFFELGGNSLLAVAVSAEIAAATGVPVTVRWLYATPTVGALAARIAGYDGRDADDDALGVLLPLRRKGTRPPLFCVHSAVPLAWCYAGLAQHITDRPVYGLQAAVLTSGADAATIDELVDDYLDAIRAVQPQGPYHLLGWSLGGQIAHALAVRLRADGEEVAVLAMLDSVVVPPGTEPPTPPRMRDLLTHLLGDEPDDADDAPDLTAAEAAAELARAPGSFGTGLTASRLERLHRGYVAGVALAHGYRPRVFDGDLLYFSATRGVTAALDARMWRPYVTGELIEHPVDATHAQLTNSAVVAVIGPILARRLKRVAESALSR
ncbi:amino acid adenylation domain-containing protein [Nocardia sp. CDC159]|uniref:Amino acid adenylation domain-containing protein n=1 Tax=Nocardia pulmonis TaxID=2951408 RepID=A0A9X2E7R1_9NOCA|nr:MULTISPECIES: amino acid adenylation domain-containing protein [Nocardia]MCM6775667.1 amino acid adenylation domain-containing protein [Nocardia pulmonis]MCM6788357.1 amino acid adenylation domain-containing protein [Nocardia sp. CDC159]